MKGTAKNIDVEAIWVLLFRRAVPFAGHTLPSLTCLSGHNSTSSNGVTFLLSFVGFLLGNQRVLQWNVCVKGFTRVRNFESQKPFSPSSLHNHSSHPESASSKDPSGVFSYARWLIGVPLLQWTPIVGQTMFCFFFRGPLHIPLPNKRSAPILAHFQQRILIWLHRR